MSSVTEPTLADVAGAAGVSVATASRVLSGARYVSEEKSKAVRKAIAALGYRHNAVASALRSQRTETVGLILPRYSTGFLSALIESVSAALDDAGLSLVLRYSSDGDAHDSDTVEALLGRRVDGIIICPPSEEVSRDAIASAGRVPVVQVGRYLFGDATDSVGLDDHRATELLVGRMAAGGARSLLSVGLSEDIPADARRIAALRASCTLHGLRFVQALAADAVLAGGIAAGNLLVGGRVTAGAGLGTGGRAELGSAGSPADRAALGWNGEGVDSIVCANDDVAHGLATILRLNGVAVPAQVQVASLLDVSFDDSDDRAITTLRHPWSAMGREAVRLLLNSLGPGGGAGGGGRPGGEPAGAGGGGARRVTFAPQLLLGASSR